MSKDNIPAVRAEVSDNEVDVTAGATNLAVERTGPDLGVGRERVSGGPDLEV